MRDLDQDFDQRMAARLKALRSEHGHSLDRLASLTGISRATLARLENGEVSPTASVLGRLCPVYGLTMSRLMQLVEEAFEPLITPEQQFVWADPETGFRRRSISPPSHGLAGEVIACEVPEGRELSYDASPRAGLEHHLLMQGGALEITVSDRTFHLREGDCLRYRLDGASRFLAIGPGPARYIIFLL